jgi:hypothetical protein
MFSRSNLSLGGEMKRLCFECVRINGQVVSIIEEPADFALNLWDENTSPFVVKIELINCQTEGSGPDARFISGKVKVSWHSKS